MTEYRYLVYHQPLGVGDGNLICVGIHKRAPSITQQNSDGIEVVARKTTDLGTCTSWMK